MNYYITRGGQQYGPYSLADLQRYVASGNILPTDMGRSETMNQWVPVSQILAGGQTPAPQQPAAPQPATPQPAAPQPYAAQQPAAQQPAAPQGYGQTPMYAPQQGVAPQQVVMGTQAGPLPPGLHWALVLLLAIVTCGIFSIVWMFIEANFVKKIRPNCNAIMLYALGIGGAFVLGFILAVSRSLVMLSPLINIGCAVVMIVGHFQMKAALEDYYNTVEPINLRLSGVMVFFFNILYFQYHFSRIRTWKTTGVWQ
jgi:hypothetical protein